MQVNLIINCPECDEELIRPSLHLTDEDIPNVHVIEFEQTDCYCSNCKKTFYIGDIDILSKEEIF